MPENIRCLQFNLQKLLQWHTYVCTYISLCSSLPTSSTVKRFKYLHMKPCKQFVVVFGFSFYTCTVTHLVTTLYNPLSQHAVNNFVDPNFVDMAMYVHIYVCMFTTSHVCVLMGYGVVFFMYLYVDSNEFTDYFGVASAIDYTPGSYTYM